MRAFFITNTHLLPITRSRQRYSDPSSVFLQNLLVFFHCFLLIFCIRVWNIKCSLLCDRPSLFSDGRTTCWVLTIFCCLLSSSFSIAASTTCWWFTAPWAAWALCSSSGQNRVCDAFDYFWSISHSSLKSTSMLAWILHISSWQSLYLFDSPSKPAKISLLHLGSCIWRLSFGVFTFAFIHLCL